MSHVRVNAKVITDDTGHRLNIPIILVERNGELTPLNPLIDYLIKYSSVRSQTWMVKLCQITGLLLDFMAAHREQFEKPVALFEVFSQRIFTGTIGDDGNDPSGLYWLPRRTKSARQLLQMLSEFSDFVSTTNGTPRLNPWVEASSYEELLSWAAFINKSERSFLGHLNSFNKASSTMQHMRSVRLRATPRGDKPETKAFPEEKLQNLISDGFIKPGMDSCPDLVEKYDWRGICLTLLMNGGGLRDSECFHLWVHDIIADPSNPEMALVRVYHPIDGAAPKDFKLPSGQYAPNRQAYLSAKHPPYIPRNLAKGTYHAGWKNPRLTDTNLCYVQVHWFPSVFGKHFLHAWKMYMRQRLRARISAEDHPFLFVSFRGNARGKPYTIDSFRQAHARAVKKIGLVPAKYLGTTEHGHRHAYGQRGAEAKLDKRVLQAGLHHLSIESQEVYTEPSFKDIDNAMAIASNGLAKNLRLPSEEFSLSLPKIKNGAQ